MFFGGYDPIVKTKPTTKFVKNTHSRKSVRYSIDFFSTFYLNDNFKTFWQNHWQSLYSFLSIIIITIINKSLRILVILAQVATLTHISTCQVLFSAGTSVERSDLHLHWTISRVAIGAERTIVVNDLSTLHVSVCLKYPFCRGSSCGSCWAIALVPMS